MTADEYQHAALRTAPVYPEEAGKLPSLINGLMGLNGEAGEAIDILKKHLFHGHKLDKNHLARELGDIAWYLAVTADALGYKLEDILRMNVDKLMARYPEGFDAKRSQHRDPNDI